MSPLVRFSHFRAPSKAILKDTLPMGLFQVGGHIFSSMAISRIPVSTVHTIKVCRSQPSLCTRTQWLITYCVGSITALHGRNVRADIRRIVQRPDLPIATTSHAGRYASVQFRRLSLKRRGPTVRVRLRARIRLVEHLL